MENTKYQWIILLVGSLFHFTFTAAWIFVPLIGDLEGVGFASDLAMETFQVSLVYSAPLLAFVIFTFIGGMIADRIGVKRATILSGVLITCFGMLRGIAPNFLFLLLTSFLFGVGGGLLYPNLGKIVEDWFIDRKKGTASGFYLMAGGLGQVFSLTITIAVLMPAFQQNWRFCFLFYGLLSFVVLIAWIFIAKEKHTTRTHQKSALSFDIMKQILLNRYIIGLIIIVFFAFSVLVGLTNYMNELLKSKSLINPVYFYLASILSLGTTIGNISFPTLSDLLQKRRVFLLAGSAVASGILLLLITATGEFLWPLIFGLGLCVGTLIPLCLTICLEIGINVTDYAGTLTGVVLSFGFLGSFTVTLIIGGVLSVTGIFLIALGYLISLGIIAFLISFQYRK